MIQKLCKNLGITLHYSSTYSPQTQGKIERVNGVIKKSLINYLTEDADNWSENLQFAVFCHNITPMESLNWLSPHFLMFGQEPNVLQETYAKREDQLSKLKKNWR